MRQALHRPPLQALLSSRAPMASSPLSCMLFSLFPLSPSALFSLLMISLSLSLSLSFFSNVVASACFGGRQMASGGHCKTGATQTSDAGTDVVTCTNGVISPVLYVNLSPCFSSSLFFLPPPALSFSLAMRSYVLETKVSWHLYATVCTRPHPPTHRIPGCAGSGTHVRAHTCVSTNTYTHTHTHLTHAYACTMPTQHTGLHAPSLLPAPSRSTSAPSCPPTTTTPLPAAPH